MSLQYSDLWRQHSVLGPWPVSILCLTKSQFFLLVEVIDFVDCYVRDAPLVCIEVAAQTIGTWCDFNALGAWLMQEPRPQRTFAAWISSNSSSNLFFDFKLRFSKLYIAAAYHRPWKNYAFSKMILPTLLCTIPHAYYLNRCLLVLSLWQPGSHIPMMYFTCIWNA